MRSVLTGASGGGVVMARFALNTATDDRRTGTSGTRKGTQSSDDAAGCEGAGTAGADNKDRARSTGDRLDSLTGLRFLAAFLVFGFHLQLAHVFGANSTAGRALTWAFGHGAIGVSFFFALSGFVLTWSARPGEPARAVWRRRAAKIYPNHLVTAVIALAGAAWVGSGSTSGPTVLGNLLLVQAWSPDRHVYFGLNTVAWSLSCEAFFYLCFPLLLRGFDRLTGRFGDRALWPAALGLAALVWCAPLISLAWSDRVAYWFVYVFPPVRLAEFCLGIALARIVRAGRWIRVPIWGAAALLVAAYLSIGYVPDRVGYVALTVIPLALLIPAVAVADTSRGGTLMARRRMVRLGEVSFAFYLVHQLVIRYAGKLLHVPGAAAPAWGFAHAAIVAVFLLAAALCGAWLLHIWVEKPLSRRLARARVKPSAVAVD